ncbi:Aspartic proteinase nepenthesin-1 [Ananas comosus]|uniref:Aspartic proteinase nepenthesin-1 n=1 Tax=Ananas comosus TaxID=4615 RepID=A0A199UFK2_ANACO|nr:Aspartic proteinase nepenthesin-1 [Ananas comosus]
MLLLLISSSSLLPLAFSSLTGLAQIRSSAKFRAPSWKQIKEAVSFLNNVVGLLTNLLSPRQPQPSNITQLGRISSTSNALTRLNVPFYTVDVGIGSPPQPTTLLLDVALDFVWTQCRTCTLCFKQPSPNFDPSKSKTYSKIPCKDNLCPQAPSPSCPADCLYDVEYDTDLWTRGVMATETFALGSASFPNLAFGCGTNNSGFNGIASGVMGLGRGSLSLTSQLKVSKFSHCFVSYYDNTSVVSSPFMIGDSISLSPSALSTPFVKNPTMYPFSSFYYLSLTAVTVGTTLVPMPSTVTEVNYVADTGGLVIDATTPFTYLDDPAYKAVRQAFVSQIKLPLTAAPDGFDLCFALSPNVESVEVPDVVFHFQGADMALPPKNVFIADRADGLLCLMMGNSTGISVLGNFQLQNMHVLYDLGKQALSFEPAQCSMSYKTHAWPLSYVLLCVCVCACFTFVNAWSA